MKVTYSALTPEGSYTEYSDKITLEVLQRHVGGLVEVIDLPHIVGHPTMWINEEGKLINLEFNPYATQVARRILFTNDWISGTVVFTGGPDKNGDTKNIPKETVEFFRRGVDKVETI